MFRKYLVLQNLDRSILIAEPVHFGDTHVQVNSAFTALFRQLYAQHKIQLIAEEKHLAALRANAGDTIKDIASYSFLPYSRPGFLYWPQKILGECRQIIRVMREARESKPELLVWLSLFPTGHFLLQWLSRRRLPGQKQVIVLHGELEYLKPGQKSRADRFLGAVLKKALSSAGKDTVYIVLGDPIKANLLQLGILNADQIAAVSHPYLYTLPDQKDKSPALPLRICTFGTLKKAKNTQLFFEMAGRFAPEIDAGKLSFTSIGKLSEDLYSYRSAYVNQYKPSEFIPQKEYEQEIRQHDLALFFYDREQYSLTASGVVHECINLGLPFLTLPNDYFTALTKQHAVGLSFGSVDEMEIYIRNLLHNADNKRQTEYQSSVFSFIQENSFLLQSEKLKSVLDHHNLYTGSS